MPSTGQAVQPKPRHGAFSQVTEGPFSFPKAEGAHAVVDLGINSQDEAENREDGGRRASMWRQNRKLEGNEGPAMGPVKVPRQRPKWWKGGNFQVESRQNRLCGWTVLAPPLTSLGPWTDYPSRASISKMRTAIVPPLKNCYKD